jgi:hypothetical protein
VLTRAVLAVKVFVDTPGNINTLLTCVNKVLSVLTPWPTLIVLAPNDKAVLILLNGIGMIFDNELRADIDVLNEDEPRELKRVIVEELKKRPLLEK